MARNGSRRVSANRKTKAKDSMTHLSGVLDSSLNIDNELADIAARDILRVSKKHGVRSEISTRKKICRSCEAALIPGKTAQVRIVSEKTIITCLRCGRVNRNSLVKQ
ncbi:MAG: ribonuclease P Rpr2/Rpp21/SNM1 subunit [Candidatus Thalassarchaeaceae archaeon]|jgi:ribonuclease P protein subunit RPR2|nr:ribonuclease P Rpr2/Rpp21/SNM1 subunit [Candidatus Thalassarchaeaceae archaeon]HJM29859.1 ribonuclease P Rpr2/Rpp21/SNM1 subunit [Candidatus Thalassarchaeaceae archaeon]|tara:strand:+ start:251 stop:571 length:321 start_codon:yes stop_codon:yes gene_type:complete